jgi:hypothetical protein
MLFVPTLVVATETAKIITSVNAMMDGMQLVTALKVCLILALGMLSMWRFDFLLL